MKNFITKWWSNRIVRYIFFGGCTTLVNLCVYYLLRLCTSINYNVANTISVAAAILFAYVVNSSFVFRSNASSAQEKLYEFIKFVGVRLSTMLIEVAGVWILVEFLLIPDLFSKIFIQFIVLVLNYVFSKFWIFVKK